MLVFVDTSAWYELLNGASREGDAVQAALKKRGVRPVTSTFVFDETVTLVRRRNGHAAAVATGQALRSDGIELMPVDESDIDAAWDLFCARTDKSYSFTDCTSFVLMRRLGIKKAVALDEDFEREGFEGGV